MLMEMLRIAAKTIGSCNAQYKAKKIHAHTNPVFGMDAGAWIFINCVDFYFVFSILYFHQSKLIFIENLRFSFEGRHMMPSFSQILLLESTDEASPFQGSIQTYSAWGFAHIPR